MDTDYVYSFMEEIFEHDFICNCATPCSHNLIVSNKKIKICCTYSEVWSSLLSTNHIKTNWQTTFYIEKDEANIDTFKKWHLTPFDFIKILKYMKLNFTNDKAYIENAIECVNKGISIDSIKLNDDLYAQYVDLKSKYDSLKEKFDQICLITKSF